MCTDKHTAAQNVNTNITDLLVQNIKFAFNVKRKGIQLHLIPIEENYLSKPRE